MKRELLNQACRCRRVKAASAGAGAGRGARREFMVSFESKVLRFALGAAKRLNERRKKRLMTRYLPVDGLFHRWAAFCRVCQHQERGRHVHLA